LNKSDLVAHIKPAADAHASAAPTPSKAVEAPKASPQASSEAPQKSIFDFNR
jgi:hypothetical protein